MKMINMNWNHDVHDFVPSSLNLHLKKCGAGTKGGLKDVNKCSRTQILWIISQDN